MKLIFSSMLFAIVVAVSSCSGTKNGEVKNEPVLPFEAALVLDEYWNGKDFPSRHSCAKEGGDAKSPTFKVENIPAGTNVLLVEFNDAANPALAYGGGLGTVGYYHKSGSPEALLLPVRGGFVNLNDYAFLEKSHRVKNISPAAYVPLCRDENPHAVEAVVKAVRRTGTFENSQTEVLAETVVIIGEIAAK